MADQGIRLCDVITVAQKQTGLTDLGDDRFLVPLGKLIDSLNTDVVFAPGGRDAMAARFERVVANRLRFTADLKAHPEILDEKLLSPVAIMGLPRVGSTKLHRMLASSGSFQDPLFWQVFNPGRMTTGEIEGEDPRIADAEAYVAWRNSTNPAANAAHHIDVHDVEEESFLLEFSFETNYQMAFVNAASFYEYILTLDRSLTYDFLGKSLKYLQWQFHRTNPKPWILKSPPNLGFEGQIQKMAPDTRFIMSHRDPVTIVASLAALMKQSRRLYCDEATIDMKKIGQEALREFTREARLHLEWRRANPDTPVLDLSYHDIERKPLDVVRKAYDYLQLELKPEVKTSIQNWLANDKHDSRMRHEYSLEESGLTAEQIEEGFADYIETFAPYLKK